MDFDKELVRGSIVPIILKLLSDQSMYGYEMVKAVNDRSGQALEWREGTLYPALHKLEAGRLIRSRWEAGPSGKDRKYYHLTRKGRALLVKRTDEWREFSFAVNSILFAEGA